MSESDPQQFIYIVRPPRPSFAEDATDEELAKVGEHFAYLQDLLAKGVLILAGRTYDTPPEGYVIFEVDDEAAAKRVMEADPAVVAGIFRAELRPYRVALYRGS